ncbi:MAG TPA: DUF6249 domain-containing protein [Bacteroidales bacterium]|nr:DUF6249 domain-containing protein [Bacteroidales bacterium]
MEVLIAFIAFFATVFGIMYVFYTTRNKERMALIEKGADATLFNTGKTSFFSWGKLSLKLGMLSIGIALGILIGELLTKGFNLDDDISFPSMIFMFGGLALVLFYFVDRKLK